jgi:MFS transporter, DHA2 family, multidrug resistance protein
MDAADATPHLDGGRGHVHPWLEALSVLTGTFMVVLDTTVVNVSLPQIAGSLSASIEESTWALTSYLAANAVILPMTGWLSTFFGRKRLMILSIIGFTIASFLCGLAPSLTFLVVCRVIQGATGGVMQPLSQAIMLEAFPPAERGKAMGFWGLGIIVAPILGPVLGGWLTDNYSWRWVFYINIPIGVIAVALNYLYLFDPPYLKRMVAKIDYWGLSLLALGIAALQIALDKGEQEDWFSSNLITALIVVAVVGLTALVIRELRTDEPIVDFRVFRERTYATGTLLITLTGFVLFGSMVLVPVMLQTVMRYPPLQAGYAMAPRGLGSLIAMPLVGLLTTRVDPRKLVGLGLALGAWTMFELSHLNLQAGYWDIFWPQFNQGIALGLLFVPLTTITMDRIPREQMGNASSLFNLLRNIGGGIGIASIQTLLANRTQAHINVLGAHMDAYSLAGQQLLAGLKATFMARGADAVTATQRAYAAAYGMVQQQAVMMSFIDGFRLLGYAFLVFLPLIFLMRKPTHAAEHPTAVAE